MSLHIQLSVLILDGDKAEASRLVQEFAHTQCRVTTADVDNQKIADVLVPYVPGLIVIDPETILERHRSQEWILQTLHSRFPAAGIIVQTRRYSLADCFRCAQTGAAAYLAKPTSAVEVLASLRQPAPPLRADTGAAPPLSLARMEWEHICRVLDACRGNKTRAAAMLDIPRFTLQRKLRKTPPMQVQAG
jgi:two-component system, response regulator RegA